MLTGAGEAAPDPVILHKMARIQGIYVGSRKDFVEMNRAIALTAAAARWARSSTGARRARCWGEWRRPATSASCAERELRGQVSESAKVAR